MNWDRAKNLTIIFLVLLNAFLSIFVYLAKNRYVMDAKRVKTIENVLIKNNIFFGKTAIPRSYPPMRALSMSKYNSDPDEWLAIFFPDQPDVQIAEEPDKITYQYDDRIMTLQNGYVSYDNPKGSGALDLTESSAVQACARCLTAMGGEIARFQLDTVYAEEDGYRVRYCQRYKGNVISTNFASFLVTDNGITQVDCQYSKPLGFSGNPMSICSADEALLNFTRHFISAYGNLEAEITNMDLVYYQTEGSVEDGVSLKATPYYRVFVDQIETPFIINAYMNTQ